MREMVPIQDFLKVHYGKALKEDGRDGSGTFEVFGSSGFVGNHNKTLVDFPTIIIGRKGSVGAITYAPNGGWPIDTTFYVEPINSKQIDLRYLFYAFKNAKLARHTITTSIPGLNRNDIYKTEIPLPPLAEQQRIAAILDQADALRTKRRAALAKLDTLLQATFLDMFGDPVTNPMGWEVKPLGEVTDVKTGSTPSREHEGNYGGIVPWVKTTEVNWGTITQTEETVSKQGIKSARLKTYPKNSILIAMYGQGKTRGKSAVLGIDATVNQACAVLLPTNKFETEYIAVLLKHSYETIRNLGRGGNQPNLNLELVKSFQIPLPPVELQNDFSKIIKKIL